MIETSIITCEWLSSGKLTGRWATVANKPVSKTHEHVSRYRVWRSVQCGVMERVKWSETASRMAAPLPGVRPQPTAFQLSCRHKGMQFPNKANLNICPPPRLALTRTGLPLQSAGSHKFLVALRPATYNLLSALRYKFTEMCRAKLQRHTFKALYIPTIYFF